MKRSPETGRGRLDGKGEQGGAHQGGGARPQERALGHEALS
jgi:hypothetical protein